MVQLGQLQSEADFVVVSLLSAGGAPGCAREAIGFRDIVPELAKRRVKVVGITASPASEITAFAKEHNLNFDVLCDSMRRISEEWGALRNDNTARMIYRECQRRHHACFRASTCGSMRRKCSHAVSAVKRSRAAETPASTTPRHQRRSPVQTPGGSAGGSAHPPVSAGHSAGPDLVAEAACAVLKLLLMHKQSGGAIPPDVSELLAQLGQRLTPCLPGPAGRLKAAPGACASENHVPAACDAKAIAAPVYLPGRQRLGEPRPSSSSASGQHLERALKTLLDVFGHGAKPGKQRAGGENQADQQRNRRGPKQDRRGDERRWCRSHKQRIRQSKAGRCARTTISQRADP